MYDIDQTFSTKADRWTEIPEQRLPVLVVLRGAQLGRRYLLNENFLVMGRSPQRDDLVLSDDREASGRHCRIEFNPARNLYTVLDLGSTNGTRVNGQRIHAAELRDGDKLLVGSTILKFTFQDVIESEFHHELERMMNIDELPGLVVLRLFRESFRLALAAAQTTETPVAVFMMDMDGLKKINDTHGHQFGAFSISSVGRLIARQLPPQGLASRFGGDEFTAYVPGLNRDQAVELGEKIRQAVEHAGLELDGVSLKPTISIGVAAMPEAGQTVEALTRCADEALYRAKAAGRNCVRV